MFELLQAILGTLIEPIAPMTNGRHHTLNMISKLMLHRHFFGTRIAGGLSSSVSSPRSPSDHNFSSGHDEVASEGIKVVARISRHILREERSYTICRNVINSVDPEGLHVVRPLELLRLPARNGNEETVIVAIVEHPGFNYLARVMDFGPAWYFVKLHRVGDRLEAVPDTSHTRSQIPLDKFLKFAVGYFSECIPLKCLTSA